MISTEKEFQDSLEIDLSEFEVKGSTSGRKSSVYSALYEFIPKMQVGKVYKLVETLGYNTERTAKHNKTNILSVIGKSEALKGYTIVGIICATKATATEPSVEFLALKCTKRPMETSAIPENLVVETGKAEIPSIETIPTEDEGAE